jgi:hypothetical protein
MALLDPFRKSRVTLSPFDQNFMKNSFNKAVTIAYNSLADAAEEPTCIMPNRLKSYPDIMASLRDKRSL